eukprot:8659753-Pyramimonas_sp.AAC.1
MARGPVWREPRALGQAFLKSRLAHFDQDGPAPEMAEGRQGQPATNRTHADLPMQNLDFVRIETSQLLGSIPQWS